MARTSVVNLIRRDLKHLGLLRTIVDLFFRAVNCCVYFRIVRALKLERVKPEFLEADEFEWRFFLADDLDRLAEDPANELSREYLTAALEKGDRCYGATDGSALVTYAWISHEPTDADGLVVHFDPQYLYFYKAFTSPSYRGRRLNSVCAHRVLREFLDDGCRGFVSDIDAHNFASLHAAERMGYEPFGWGVLFKLGHLSFARVSRSCRKHGYYFATTKLRRRRSDRKTEQEAVAVH